MPHLSIEYSANLESRIDLSKVARAAYDAMIEAEIFPLAGIRVRLHRADFCIVADDHPENNFLAATLSVGAGRSTEVLNAAGQKVFAALQESLADLLAAPDFALSLEIRVSDPNLSWKDTPIHARLSKKD